jgi:hypothetical protein
MKQKLIIAGIIGCIAVAGCKSRFTSTADASGPRKHDHADPSFEHSGNIGNDTLSLTGIHDSGNVHTMNMHGDTNFMSKPVDSAHVIAH